MKHALALVLLFILSGNAAVFSAPYDAFVFDTPEQEKIFNKLNGELRCLVCQNQALSDSNADMARDLRVEIHAMLLEGKSEDEIITFMVERYGDYVLYRPPFKPLTWLLWFGPLVAFIVGVFYARKFIRENNDENSTGELSGEELERMRSLQSEAEDLYKKDVNKSGVQK